MERESTMNLKDLAKQAAAKPETQAQTFSLKGFNIAGQAPAKATKAAPAAESSFNIDLNGVDLSSIESTPSQSADDELIQFADYQIVEAPVRSLPPELNDQQRGFVTLLDSVYGMHHDANAVKTAVSRIMIDMRETPYLADLVMDQDVTLIISKMKQIMGYRKEKEVKAKAKRQTSKSKKIDEDLAAILGDIEL